jgi:hypothetical protein
MPAFGIEVSVMGLIAFQISFKLIPADSGSATRRQARFARSDTIRSEITCLCIGQKGGYFSIPFTLANKTNLELA